MQSARLKSDKEIFPSIMHRVDFGQMLLKAIRRPTVGNYKVYKK